MLTLAITTTTRLAGISLHEDSRLLGEIKIEVVKTHSGTIIEQIDRLFSWTGKKLEDVKNVLVSVGPGSFTGVRIGISVVKGLFYGRDVDYYGINELEALAYQAFYILEKEFENKIEAREKKIYSLIDSGKEKIYMGIYKPAKGKLEKEAEHEVIRLDSLIEKINSEEGKIIIVGDAGFNYKSKISEKTDKKAEFLMDEAMKITTVSFMKMFSGKVAKKMDALNLKPDYLEKSQAERDRK